MKLLSLSQYSNDIYVDNVILMHVESKFRIHVFQYKGMQILSLQCQKVTQLTAHWKMMVYLLINLHLYMC